MKMNPNSLANLRPLQAGVRFDGERAREMQKKAVEVKKAKKELREKFKESYIALNEIKKNMPDITGIEVLRVCMHMALNDKNYEDAARYADKIAEYEQPKLQRVEKNVTTRTADLTDEELKAIIEQEGLAE